MHEKFMKMLGKKRDLPEHEKRAKMDVIKSLHDDAASMMGDKLHKVTVASDSKEGLHKGLEKADEVLKNLDEGKMLEEAENPYQDSDDAQENNHPDLPERKPGAWSEGGEVSDEESPEHEASESPEEEMAEQESDDEDEDQESPEEEEQELDRKIQELLEKKKQLEARKK